jgi:hypothetical protein
MATKTRRKSNTALVFNPAGRSLSIGGSRRTNPARKRRRRHATTHHRRRRRNPVMKTVAVRRRNPVRRRRNPSTASGLLVAAVFAGIGVSIFDVVATKVVPQSSALVRAATKLGGAWIFQSKLGSKVPVLGKYRNDIALVLAVSGVVDLMKLYVFPLVGSVAGSVGLLNGSPLMAIDDGTTGNIYGNAYSPDYLPYA